MKNIIYTFALVFTFAGSALAQSTAEERAATVTRDMSEKLSLNESEYIKLKSMNRDRFTRAFEITSQYSNDMAMRDMKLAELQNAYDNQLREFLNPKQLEAYATYKETNTNFTAFTPEETK